MFSIILTYEGYSLSESGSGYKSQIAGRWMNFDSVGQWKRFIDSIKGKK